MTLFLDSYKSVESIVCKERTYEDAFEIYREAIRENHLKPKCYEQLHIPLHQFSRVCEHLYRSSHLTDELYQKMRLLSVLIQRRIAQESSPLPAASIFSQLGNLFANLDQPLEASKYFKCSAQRYRESSQFLQAAAFFEKEAIQYRVLGFTRREIQSLEKASQCYMFANHWENGVFILTKAINRCFVCYDFFRVEKFCKKVDRCYEIHLKVSIQAAHFFVCVAKRFEKYFLFESAAQSFKKAAIYHQSSTPPNTVEADENFANAARLYLRVAKQYEKESHFKWAILSFEEAAICSKSSEAEPIYAKVASFYKDFALQYESRKKPAKAASCWMKAGEICAHKIPNRESEALKYFSRAHSIYTNFLAECPDFSSLSLSKEKDASDQEASCNLAL